MSQGHLEVDKIHVDIPSVTKTMQENQLSGKKKNNIMFE